MVIPHTFEQGIRAQFLLEQMKSSARVEVQVTQAFLICNARFEYKVGIYLVENNFICIKN